MDSWREHLNLGQVIPACPLALNEDGTWSRRHQRGLLRYYVESGAGGLAVGVHTTQFAIRDPKHDLFKPVLSACSEWISELTQGSPFIKIAGVCGRTPQALEEAEFAMASGYHAGLLSLAAFGEESESDLLRHCEQVSDAIPIIGFYLQSLVGGRVLSHRFWRALCENPRLVAIKIAPFNRYQTIDVVRAVMESGREDVALYTGNDDNIIADLLTPFRYAGQERRIVGGLLGQWAVWTRRAVEMLEEIRQVRLRDSLPFTWLSRNAALTDANAALFDAANEFAGCIPGIHEVLRRQGLMPSIRCLDAEESLSKGQMEEIDRVIQAYDELTDDEFVRANLPRWLT